MRGTHTARSTRSRSILAQSEAAARGLVAFNDWARRISRSMRGSQNQPWTFAPAHANQVTKKPYGVSPHAAGVIWVVRKRSGDAFAKKACGTRRTRAW